MTGWQAVRETVRAAARAPARPAVPVPAGTPAPALASLAVQGLLAGPVRAATVLGAFPQAIYLLVAEPAADRSGGGRPAGEPAVLAVVGTDGARLPQALVLTAGPLPRLPAAPPAAVRVGGGTVRLGGQAVAAAGWWDPVPAVERPTAPALVAAGTALAAALARSGVLAGLPPGSPTGPLGRALARRDLAAAGPAARALVGLGPGLTPSGDDYLCGLLATLAVLGTAADRAFGAGLGDAVRADAASRTTALAASLLGHARRGECSAELGRVLCALGGAEPVEAALAGLLRFGATSGADLATGVLAGLRALTAADGAG